jgi:hypothetical protein
MLLDAIVKLQEKTRNEQFVERPRPGELMNDFRKRTGWTGGEVILSMPISVTEQVVRPLEHVENR